MELLDIIHAAPGGPAAYAARDCHELARICSIGRTRPVLVPIADVQAKLQETGTWWAIKAISDAPEHPAYLAAVAVTDVARARYTNLDMSLPIIVEMFGALVQAGALAQQTMEAIVSMGLSPAPFTQREIAVELFHDDGTPKQ